MFSTNVDNSREHGLKKTPLSVLDQRKQHKTKMQKTFQQFSQQSRRNAAAAAAAAEQQGFYQLQEGFSSHEMMAPPRTQSIQSSPYRAQSFVSNRSSDHFLPPQPPIPQSMSPNGPLLQQGDWLIEPRSSKGSFVTDNTGYNYGTQSTRMSPGSWVDENSALREHIERLLVLEEENAQLREMNIQLREDNNLLLGHIQEQSQSQKQQNSSMRKDESEELKQLREQVELQDAELRKLSQNKAELEAQVAHLSENVTKLKLVSKTSQDKKDKVIESLREDVQTLEKELDTLMNSQVSTTRDTSPMASPLSSSENVIKTPPTVCTEQFTSSFQSGKKDLKNQMQMTMNEDLVQDLLHTIRSLRQDRDLLQQENIWLCKSSEKDKRLLKALANAKNHKVKIRKGLTIVSHVDTLI